jgi:hypothetical protein
MTIQHYAIAVTLALFFLGTLFGLVKYIAHQQEQREKDRYQVISNLLEKLTSELREEAAATLGLERRFMEFKADLPRDYVRRDDFIRAIGTIEAKVDNFALRMERALMTRSSGGTP